MYLEYYLFLRLIFCEKIWDLF